MEFVKLGDIVTIKKGKKPLFSELPNEKSVRVLQIGDLRNDNNLKFTDDKTGVLVDAEDVLLAWDGANAGTVGYGKTGYIGSTIAVLKKKNSKDYSTVFIGKFLQSQFEYLRSKATGATIPHIDRKSLDSLKLPVIDFTEQIRIAEILTQAENLITQRKESILLLDELLRSTFLEMFGDPVRNEKGWKQDYLQNYSIKISSGSTPLGGKEVYQRKGKFFIRSQNVRMNFLDYSDIYCISDEIHNKMKRTWIKNEDVLLNITGASIGRIATYYGEDDNANVNQHVCIIRTIKEKLNPRFLEYQIAENHFQKVCIGASTGGTRESFTFEMIKKFNIILPPLELQTRFAIIVKKVETLKTEYQTSLKELENMYGVLSQKAFKGELKVTEYTNNEVLGMVAETKGEY